MMRLPKGVAQVIVLAVDRFSGGYTSDPPPIVRNSSLATMLISNTWVDFCLRRIASSSFNFHVDCTSSLSAKSRVVPPRRPSWWMVRGGIARASAGGGEIPQVSGGKVVELSLVLIDPRRLGVAAAVSTLRRSRGIGYRGV